MKKIPIFFMESEGSLLCSQLDTGPYPESDESNSYLSTLSQRFILTLSSHLCLHFL